MQKRWHVTSVYNERWDSAKSYPNFPGRKRFIMRKDFPWIMREVNHWLCICANISHKGDGSCRSWIKLIRCQRFCNRVYTRTLFTSLWNLMSRNLTSLRYKCEFLINIWSQNNQVKYHLFLSRQSGVYHCDLRPIGSRVTVTTREVLLRIMRVRHLVSWMKLFFHVPEMYKIYPSFNSF